MLTYRWDVHGQPLTDEPLLTSLHTANFRAEAPDDVSDKAWQRDLAKTVCWSLAPGFGC